MCFDVGFGHNEDIPEKIDGCKRRELGVGVSRDMTVMDAMSTRHRADELSGQIVAA